MTAITVGLEWAIRAIIAQNPKQFYSIDIVQDGVLTTYCGSTTEPVSPGDLSKLKYATTLYVTNPAVGHRILHLAIADVLAIVGGMITERELIKAVNEMIVTKQPA